MESGRYFASVGSFLLYYKRQCEIKATVPTNFKEQVGIEFLVKGRKFKAAQGL